MAMRRIRAGVARVAGLFTARRRARAFAAELESHLQMHVDDNLRAGMTADRARREALLKLGGVAAVREAYRDRGSVPLLEHVWQDVRFALRQLLRTPVFTVTAVLVTGLGLGVTAAIFGLVDAALLRPLPYLEPQRLVDVTGRTPLIPRGALSYLDAVDWRRGSATLAALDVHAGRGLSLTTASGTEIVPAGRVSAGFFRTLGVAPALGRDFRPGDDAVGAPLTVVLGHETWQSRFGGRAGVIGEVVTLGTEPHTVVGVLPRGFHFAPLGGAAVWVPLQPASPCERRRSCHNLGGVGRLKDGVTIEAARAEMTTIAARLEQQYPDSNRDQGASVLPLSEVIVGRVRPVLVSLFGGAALLLLIACTNVASLLLVRSEGRRRELAVRRALGASQGRLVRQFVTEAIVLAAVGGVLALAVASGVMRLLLSLVPADMVAALPFLQEAAAGPRTAGFLLVLATGTVAVFAAAPLAMDRATRLQAGLADGGRGGVASAWRRLGFKLVVVELATAVVLLAGAGLLGKSLHRLLNVALAFEPDGLVVARVVVPPALVDTHARRSTLGRDVVSRVASLPGVQAAAISSVPPVSFNGNTDWIRFVGRPYQGEHNDVNMREVSANYFQTLRVRLLKGRFFSEADTAAARRVAIINATAARLYFPGENPIGREFGDTSLTPASIKVIVGVVDDLREGALDADIWPAVYYPFDQSSDSSFSIVARLAAPSPSVMRALSAAVRELGADIAVLEPATMPQKIARSPVAYLKRSTAALVGAFAALALVLGVVGLYGVVAYSVGQRAREIGVRVALGAQRRTVYRMVLGEAARLASIGIGLGLVAAIVAATSMRNLLFGTAPWDAATLLLVSAVLFTAALLASFLPARRAASVNPVDVLRAD